MGYNIAIDGPAGAGKSTIAKMIAKQKGFVYVDTGAMYRALAVFFLKEKYDCNDEAVISDACKKAKVEIKYENGMQHVYLNGEDVTGSLRTEEVGNAASLTSKYPAVRAHLLDLQLDLADKCDVVMDGRDIGTVVLPNAQLKIYLTANSDVRAKRRCDELTQKGIECDYEQIKKDIELRDEQDKNRAVSPLKKADDAVLVDSSYMSPDEVCQTIIDMIGQN